VSLGTGTVTLADVLTRGVVVHWFEGVAIVQEVCGALSGAPQAAAPDPGTIWIDGNGGVVVRPGTAGEAPVLRLGRLLSDSIAQDSQVPPPLRLCISQATANPPMFASVEEFSQGLGYFERPDRPALVRAVYERYRLTPATQTAPVRAAAPESSATDKEGKPRKERKRSSPIGRYLALGAAAAGVTVAVLMGREHLTEAIDLEAISAALNIDALTAGTPRETETAAAEPSSRPQSNFRGAAARSSAGSSARLANVDAGGTPGADSAYLKSARVEQNTESAWLDIPPDLRAASREPAAPLISAYEQVSVFANRIYSSADDGVEPPVMVYPQLPPVPPDAADHDTVNALEVIIGDDGIVQRVRLVSQPRRMTDMMLLSAAGSWRFTPAKVDGTPVPYRATIRWSVPLP
jgi:hypothetical protein